MRTVAMSKSAGQRVSEPAWRRAGEAAQMGTLEAWARDLENRAILSCFKRDERREWRQKLRANLRDLALKAFVVTAVGYIVARFVVMIAAWLVGR